MEDPIVKSLSMRELLLAGTIISGLAMTSLPAVAQPAATEEAEATTVVVTGSRISRPDLVSNSPITSVSAVELANQNVVNLETTLRTMPQFIAGQTEYTNNADGPEGVATVDLRGLGDQRTLVLMDGKRLPPFDDGGTVDINMIPLALVQRVDVVTGGASAVYGSDAISGVVNFIMRRDFEGFAVDATATRFGEGDGDTRNISVAMGSSFAEDRGNAVLALGYTTRAAVFQGDRGYSNFNVDASRPWEGNPENFDTSINGILTFCPDYNTSILDECRQGGSSNAAATRFPLTIFNATRVDPATGIAGSRQNVNRFFLPNGTIGAAAATGGNSVFNYNPFNYFQVPQERYQAAAFVNYDVSEHIEVYARALMTSSKVDSQLAPSAYFGGSTGAFEITLDNPFLTAAQRSTLAAAYTEQTTVRDPNNQNIILTPGLVYNPALQDGSQRVQVPGFRRRMIEIGNRFGINDTNTFQMMLGAKGDLFESGWTWDVSASFSRVNFLSGTTGDIDTARAQEALLAIPGANGPQCLPGASAGCAPINIFSGAGVVDPSTGTPASGTPSAAALTFIQAAYYSTQETTQQVVSGTISGDLGAFKSPLAESSWSVALGVDYKRDYTDFSPDDLTQFGGAMGQGGTSPPLAGGIAVTEFFGELFAPLVEDRPFMQTLALEAGYRYSNSSLAGTYSSWKAGLEWVPVDGIRFRAMAQQAVRAPNLSELYTPLQSGLSEIRNDPCAGNAPVTNLSLRAVCLAQGAPPSSIGSISNPAAQQAASLSGGAVAFGTSLDPETADTITVGVVLTSEIIPGFTGSIDYYNVEISDAILTFPAQLIVDNCFQRNQAAFCSLITRNAAGELEGDGLGILRQTRNSSGLNAQGIDYNLRYTTDLEFIPGTLLDNARLVLSLMGTHTLTNEFQLTAVTPLVECEGRYGSQCGEPTPKDKFTLSASLNLGDFDFTTSVRYVGAMEIDYNPRDPSPEVQNNRMLIETLDAYTYLDFNLVWNVRDWLTVNLSADNVLDEDPPFVGNIPGANTAMNTYAGTYDPLGTRWGLGIRTRF
jgi:iron complex outermembrane recepter protein